MDRTWLKIIVVNDEAEIMEVGNRFLTRFLKTSESGQYVPRECAAFVERRIGKAPSVEVYFSPIAATLCSELISDYPQELCDPPDPSNVESLGGHGDDMEWLASLFHKDRT